MHTLHLAEQTIPALSKDRGRPCRVLHGATDTCLRRGMLSIALLSSQPAGIGLQIICAATATTAHETMDSAKATVHSEILYYLSLHFASTLAVLPNPYRAQPTRSSTSGWMSCQKLPAMWRSSQEPTQVLVPGRTRQPLQIPRGPSWRPGAAEVNSHSRSMPAVLCAPLLRVRPPQSKRDSSRASISLENSFPSLALLSQGASPDFIL